MKCPECESSKIAVNQKTGETICETCGYVFEEQEAKDYKKSIQPGQQGKKPEKKVW